MKETDILRAINMLHGDIMKCGSLFLVDFLIIPLGSDPTDSQFLFSSGTHRNELRVIQKLVFLALGPTTYHPHHDEQVTLPL